MSKAVLNGEALCKVSGSSVDLEALSSSAELLPKTCKEGFRLLTLLSTGSPVPSATVWTGSVVLALLLLAVLTYRLWKCCRQTTGPTSSSGPPALPGPD